MSESNVEFQPKPEERLKNRNEARVSLMKGLWEDARDTYTQIKNEREENGLNKERQERAKREAILALLIAAEAIPGVEMSNEGAKVLSKSEQVLKKIKDKTPEAVKVAKTKGLIGDLYPNVPNWFVSSMAFLDTVGVPFIGAAPEVIQYVHDRTMDMKDNMNVTKETISVFRQKREERRGQINEAKLAFSG